ncbi:FUSC family protein [Eubacteriaceae bacterium ES3]|nr:FUSC family protein [Eubacteriaceae bacterium ES3]
MNKKLLRTTVLFIFVMLFIAFFLMVFGSVNVIIAISTVFVILTYLTKNMTANPVKNLLKLMVFNVAMGLIAYVSSLNIFFAIPIDFLSIFLIANALSYTINSPISTPFSLQYVFLISVPVSSAELPLRLAALAAGAVCVMLVQLAVNKDLVEKQSRIIFLEICSNLENKIRNTINKTNTEGVDHEITGKVGKLKQIIYEARVDNYYFTKEIEIKLNIVVVLENCYDLINEIGNEPEKINFLEDILTFMNGLKIYFVEEDVDRLDELKVLFNRSFQKYNFTTTNDLVLMKLIEQLQCLMDYLHTTKNLDRITEKEKAKSEIPTKKFKSVKQYKTKLSIDALSRSYAFRLALAISIATFLVNYFSLQHGNWMVFTISSLTYPYYEMAKQKTVKRILGTIIGGIIVIVVFSILQLKDAGTVVMIIALFLTIFFMDNYTYSMIFSTITAISSFVLAENSTSLSLDRIIYVVIGGVIAIVLSKFILPYHKSDTEKDLMSMYDDIIVGFFKDIKSSTNYNEDFENKIINFILFASMIEDKLSVMAKDSNGEEIRSFIKIRHQLTLDIYNEYLWLLKNKNCIEAYRDIHYKIIRNDSYLDPEKDEQLVAEIVSTNTFKNKVVIWESIQVLRTMKQLSLVK